MKFFRSTLFALLLASRCLLAQHGAKQPSEAEKAIQEFRIQIGGLANQKNGAASRPRNLTRWHGRLFENFRNNALDAIPHEVRQAGQENSLLQRNQFGFNVSGLVPLPRTWAPKTYVSISYEGVRQGIDRPHLATVPTPLERKGDFSSTVDSAGALLPIYDPNTTRANPSFDALQPVSASNLEYLRDIFPGNQVPASRLDPVALAALKDYPLPNVAIGPYYQNNYFVNSLETDDADGVTGNVEIELTRRNRLITNLSWSNGYVGAAALFPSEANPGPIDHRYKDRRVQLQHIFTASSNIINSFAFSVSSIAWVNGQELMDNPAATIGLSGVGGGAYPYIQLSPYLPTGQSTPYSTRTSNTFSATDALSDHIGKHQLELDLRHSRYYVNNFAPSYPAGSFAFSSGVTSLPGIDDTGLAFASFMLGLPYQAELTTVLSPSYFLRTETVVGLHDQYQPLPQLTINAIVNLTGTTPRTEKYNRQTNLDLNAVDPITGLQGALIAAGVDGASRGLRPVRVRAEPSLGVAWNFAHDRTTVLRAGFNRNYQPIPIGSSQSNTQGYNSVQVLESPNAQLVPALELGEGFPANPHPPPYLGPDAVNNTIADYLDPSSRQPVMQAASLSLEHSLGSALLTAGFTYGGGKNLLVGNGAANPDALPLSALQYRDQLNRLAFSQSLRPYPQFLDLNLNNNYPVGRYQRDAGYMRLEQRASHGIAVYVTYVFSKQMDDYSGPYGVQDFFNRQQDWSLTPSNRARTFQVDYTWQLPIGRGHQFLNYSDWRDHLAEGWTVSGSASVYGGTPIVLHPLFNNTGGVVTGLEVDAVPGVNAKVANPSPNLWFNPAAFIQPADFTLGDVSRADPELRNPMYQNYDLSLEKRIVLDPQMTLAFGAVVLNFLNHANWNNPDSVIGSATTPNTDAGKIIGSTGGRIVQLSMRFSF
jgi:hypothetical protein